MSGKHSALSKIPSLSSSKSKQSGTPSPSTSLCAGIVKVISVSPVACTTPFKTDSKVILITSVLKLVFVPGL